jgi:L-ascorbate metabolism protein UlaG (beta-lactamase superfamily)
MNITWLGHASFLLESQGFRIITDPYDPGNLNLEPITESADIVIRSSDDDMAHAYTGSIPQPYELITATEIIEQGTEVKGIDFHAIPAQESIYREGGYKDNALYRFELEGIDISHMGDVGNPLTDTQLEALKGTEVLFVLAGGHPTIDLDDLEATLEEVQPKLVIPMHFRIPGPSFFMLPVTDFTGRYPHSMVEFTGESTITITEEALQKSNPNSEGKMHIIVLDPKKKPRVR